MRRTLVVLALVAVSLPACGGSEHGKPKRLPASTSPLQRDGLYTYKTSGFERLSAVVASRHRYPPRTTVEVAGADCGYTETWRPRPERATAWRFCTDGQRWRLASLLDYREFFGQIAVQRFVCRGPF